MTNTEALFLIKELNERMFLDYALILAKYRRKINIRWYGSLQIFKVLDNDIEVLYQHSDILQIERFISILASP